MTIDELSELAAKNERPDGAEPHDLLAWYELRDLYREYRAGRISKDQGGREKVRIIFDRQKYAEQNDTAEKDLQSRAAFWKAIENAATEYNLNPTIENADKFVKAVYGTNRLTRKGETT